MHIRPKFKNNVEEANHGFLKKLHFLNNDKKLKTLFI